VHEIAFYVHLENIARYSVVDTFLPHVELKSMYAIQSTPAFYTGVGVCYERADKTTINVVIVQMMDYSVTEIRCKNLATLGVGDNKTL